MFHTTQERECTQLVHKCRRVPGLFQDVVTWTMRKNNYQQCGDWGDMRGDETMAKPSCGSCEGLHLSWEYPHGQRTREQLVERKTLVEVLGKEGIKEDRSYREVKEEIATMYK